MFFTIYKTRSRDTRHSTRSSPPHASPSIITSVAHHHNLSTQSHHSQRFRAHMPRLLIILLVLLFSLHCHLVLASPISTSVPISDSKAVTPIKLEEFSVHENLRHAHSTSTKPTASPRLVTVVQAETLRLALPSSTEILTEIVEMTTALPKSFVLLSSLHSSTSKAHTTTLPNSFTLFSITETSSTSAIYLPTSSTVNPIVTSSTSSTLTVVSGLSATPTLPTVRKHWELSTGTLIAVTIAGSVAANILAVTLWLLMRNSCSWTDSTVDTEGKAPGDLVAERDQHGLENLREDFKNQLTTENPRQFDADVTIPEQFEIRPAPSSDQTPIPVSYSSFWSAASSQWTLERARSHEIEAPSRESEAPRHFTTLGLGTALNTDPSSIGTIEPSPFIEGLGDNSHRINVNSSPEVVRDDQTLRVPLPNTSESPRDPRSPRRLSIPLFMENYTSPSLSHCFPADTQSITMTHSGRSSYNLETGSMLLPEMESSTEVEGELGSGRMNISASMASLPSESSGVMTPRRHWTFVDIHGPSAQTVSPQGSENILNHLPGTESSHTIAGQVPSISVDHFGSGSSQTPPSEPPSADSFLHSDIETSARSGISRYCTPNNDSVDVLDHSRRTF